MLPNLGDFIASKFFLYYTQLVNYPTATRKSHTLDSIPTSYNIVVDHNVVCKLAQSNVVIVSVQLLF